MFWVLCTAVLDCEEIFTTFFSVSKCNVIADVALLLDSSNSIGNGSHWEKEKNFTKEIAGAFGLSKEGSRAGVIIFGYSAELSVKLDAHHDISSFNKVG